MAALLALRAALDSSLVYLLDRRGTTVASTPYDGGKTLTGKSYGFRPYFVRAIETRRPALYSALGVTTGQHGLYVGVPLMDPPGREVAGVLVVKSTLDNLERRLLAQPDPTLLVSPEGVVSAGNCSQWLFKTGQQYDFDTAAEKPKRLAGDLDANL